MSHATGSPRDAASVLFDLPGYRVVDAVDLPDGGREVVIAAESVEEACPSCGVLSGRVHSRTRQRVRDVPVAGQVRVVLLKRRFACRELACGRRTFAEVSDQVPLRARTTTRLRTAVLDAVVRANRAVSEVAAAHGVSWRTVQFTLTLAVLLLTDPDTVAVRRLGIDEHRYRSVRWLREAGRWRRFEPWMTTFVDLDTGRVLGVVDGRDSAAVTGWLQTRAPAWREAVEVVAIDPSAAFRKAIREQLSEAAVSVDAFHLVKLANDMVTRVRQRLSQQRKGRRGRLVDPAWANRRLLLRAGNTLSPRALARLTARPTRDMNTLIRVGASRSSTKSRQTPLIEITPRTLVPSCGTVLQRLPCSSPAVDDHGYAQDEAAPFWWPRLWVWSHDCAACCIRSLIRAG